MRPGSISSKRKDLALFNKFLRNIDDGMETIEYALIAGLIAIAAVLIYQPFGPTLGNRLNNAGASSSSAGAGNQGGGNAGGNVGGNNGNGGNGNGGNGKVP